MNKWVKIAVVVLLIVGILLLSKRVWSKAGKPKITPPLVYSTWDSVTDERIRTLHPDVQGYASLFIIRCKEDLGLNVRVTDATRTFAQQDELYAQGRTASGEVVTNAEAGESYHNYGLAFDVVEIRDGAAIWNNPRWGDIAAIAQEIGFEWGGSWLSFTDKPHFQMTFGYSISQLQNQFPDGNTLFYSFEQNMAA